MLELVKPNKEKASDLQAKIAAVCANLSHETPVYGTETAKKVAEWAQSCDDISQENIRLLTAIQRTNLATNASIEVGGKSVTKTIAEWVWRRREYAAADFNTWSKLTDRGLKEGFMQSSTGTPAEIKIQRHYDPIKRDEMLAMYRAEPHLIDAALEVVNATTELLQ
jgi:hypothetical protein